MLGRKTWYALLGTVGALALLLGGLGGLSSVSAQEATPQSEGAPPGDVLGRGPSLFGFGRGGEWMMFDAAADMLGLTPEELFAELHGGATMEDVAEAQDVDVEEVQEALQAAQEEAQREAIEQAVEDGDMSQEQADWLLEGLEQGYLHGRGLGRGFRHGPGLRGGFGRFAPGGIAPQSESSDTRAPRLPGSSSL